MNKGAQTLIVAMAMLSVAGTACARDQIRMVGSSAVFPFASHVAQEFDSLTRYPQPVVEATGTNGGVKLFCDDNGMNSPDIASATRRMTIKEFRRCGRNGVENMTEVVIGYDGIVLAGAVNSDPLDITLQELFLAVAKQVPDSAGEGLVANPYHFWDAINPELPHRRIRIYGPPTNVGLRDAFEQMVLQPQAGALKACRDAGQEACRSIRTDGVYRPTGETDGLLVKTLVADADALGIVGYAVLAANAGKITGVKINGFEPGADSISTRQYPISRSLFLYVKNDHQDQVPALREFMAMFLAPDMIGKDGLLEAIGLIPASGDQIQANRDNVTSVKRLTLGDLGSTD